MFESSDQVCGPVTLFLEHSAPSDCSDTQNSAELGSVISSFLQLLEDEVENLC
jgi:hypothetical protein